MRGPLGRMQEVLQMPQSIRIQLDDTITELLEVSDLGSGLVRLEATPLAAPRPLYRGDTVEVEVAVASPNTVRFVRVVEQAPLHHQTWIVSRSFPDSEDYGRFVGEIEAAGGSAESLLGGMLHVH